MRLLVEILWFFNVVSALGVMAPNALTDKTCSRENVGSSISQPVNLFSSSGILDVHLVYRNGTDELGGDLFCYLMSATGQQSPTLRVNPGDTILFSLRNEVGGSTSPSGERVIIQPPDCMASKVLSTSTNVHFHGLHGAPTCHRDDVLHTIINPGQEYTYMLTVPDDQPPGMYWYHPHVHGLTEAAVLGGASGVVIVNGIEQVQSAVAGMAEQIIVIRESLLPPLHNYSGVNQTLHPPPAWDLSVNNIPVPYPWYPPAVLFLQEYGQMQLWRVLNSAADSTVDLQVIFDGVPQPLLLVGIDGVPVNSDLASAPAAGLSMPEVTHIQLPAGGRAEFIITGPDSAVLEAMLVALAVDTGPVGDSEPRRPLARIVVDPLSPAPDVILPVPDPSGSIANGGGVENAKDWHQLRPDRLRYIYFSQDKTSNSSILASPSPSHVYLSSLSPSLSSERFFITEKGAKPALFNATHDLLHPQITVTQGVVEDWVIENQAVEDHVFHMHQLHFLLLQRNGEEVVSGGVEDQYMDSVHVPYWSGNSSDPYPSITIRIDFGDAPVGVFVYHCHMLNHEDAGMMGVIRVLPNNSSSSSSSGGDKQSSSGNELQKWQTGVVVLSVSTLISLCLLLWAYRRHLTAWQLVKSADEPFVLIHTDEAVAVNPVAVGTARAGAHGGEKV